VKIYANVLKFLNGLLGVFVEAGNLHGACPGRLVLVRIGYLQRPQCKLQFILPEKNLFFQQIRNYRVAVSLLKGGIFFG
jgi:hypothetical protein